MSARPGRWDLLGRAGDPVPGDTQVVERLARVHTETGAAIAESADKLRRLADLEGWTGKAAEKFGEAADDVCDDLSKAEQRYAEAGAALAGFVQPLSEARTESLAALRAAEVADEVRRSNAGNMLEGVADPTPEQVRAQERRSGRYDDGAAAVTAAQGRLDAALIALQSAAKRCGDAIREAAERGKDSRWDNIKGGLRDFVDWANIDVIVKVLAYVAIAIAVVAIAVAFIVTAPAWLATALFVAAMAVGLASLAGNATMALSGHEEGSWTNAGLDFLGLATLGASRGLTSGARATVVAQRAKIATQQASGARIAEAARQTAIHPDRAQLPGAMGMPLDNQLRIWATQQRAAQAAAASAAGDDAARAVTAPVLRNLEEEALRLRAIPPQPGRHLGPRRRRAPDPDRHARRLRRRRRHNRERR